MEFIRPFDRLGKNDADIAGGKGASLGEMTQAGIPVPQGFVMLTHAFERFLEEADLNQELDAILTTVVHKEMHTINGASEKIQSLIMAATMPADISQSILEYFKTLDAQYVAVRSSATAEDGSAAAWAGQLDTFLNTTEKDLLENVQKCWASLFTPRAIFYRFEKGMHASKISVAVVVQKMIQSEVSGIAFSVHPVTEDHNQLIIEAGFGLGEAIVSGQVTPGSYVVTKDPRSIIDTNISTQTRALVRADGGAGNEWVTVDEPKASSQVLNEAQIFELSELILKIEQHYGFPCDIEWAYEAGSFFVTQSRPITTLSSAHPENQVSDSTGPIIFKKVYTRDFPLLLEQTWVKSFAIMEGLLGVRNPYRPHIALYVTGQYLQIWEHGKAMGWFQDELLKRNIRDATFTPQAISDYRESLKKLDVFRANIHRSQDEIGSYLEALRQSMGLLNIWYYSGLDDRTPPEIREICIAIREHDYLFAEHDAFIKTFLESLGFPRDLANLILSTESDRLPTVADLANRSSGVVVVGDDLHEITPLSDFAQDHPEFVFEELVVDMSQTELAGQSGYNGRVQGQIRIVHNHADIGKVLEGDILCAPMTVPDFMPAMKKAAAFVTDEGGIMCHAAIIARELKKPCVIGTKFATQVLKDGDMVEVDADNGIVRKI